MIWGQNSLGAFGGGQCFPKQPPFWKKTTHTHTQKLETQSSLRLTSQQKCQQRKTAVHSTPPRWKKLKERKNEEKKKRNGKRRNITIISVLSLARWRESRSGSQEEGAGLRDEGCPYSNVIVPPRALFFIRPSSESFHSSSCFSLQRSSILEHPRASQRVSKHPASPPAMAFLPFGSYAAPCWPVAPHQWGRWMFFQHNSRSGKLHFHHWNDFQMTAVGLQTKKKRKKKNRKWSKLLPFLFLSFFQKCNIIMMNPLAYTVFNHDRVECLCAEFPWRLSACC